MVHVARQRQERHLAQLPRRHYRCGLLVDHNEVPLRLEHWTLIETEGVTVETLKRPLADTRLAP